MGCEVRWDEMGNGLGQEMGSDKRRHGMFSGVGYDVGVGWDWDWLAAMGWDGSRDEGSDKMGCGVGRQGMWLR